MTNHRLLGVGLVFISVGFCAGCLNPHSRPEGPDANEHAQRARETPREEVRAARDIGLVQRIFRDSNWENTVVAATGFAERYCYHRRFISATIKEYCDRAVLLRARAKRLLSQPCESIIAYEALLDSPTAGETAKRELERAKDDRQRQLSKSMGSHPVTCRVQPPTNPEVETISTEVTQVDGKSVDGSLPVPLRSGCHIVSFVGEFRGHGLDEGYGYTFRARRAVRIDGPTIVTLEVSASRGESKEHFFSVSVAERYSKHEAPEGVP